VQTFVDYPGAEREEEAIFRPKTYYNSHFILLLFCVESKETLQNCVQVWGPEVSRYRPDSLIILVGVSHCYRPNIRVGQPPSNRCVSEEEGNEAAKKIGKILESVYWCSCCCCCVRSVCLL